LQQKGWEFPYFLFDGISRVGLWWLKMLPAIFFLSLFLLVNSPIAHAEYPVASA